MIDWIVRERIPSGIQSMVGGTYHKFPPLVALVQLVAHVVGRLLVARDDKPISDLDQSVELGRQVRWLLLSLVRLVEPTHHIAHRTHGSGELPHR